MGAGTLRTKRGKFRVLGGKEERINPPLACNNEKKRKEGTVRTSGKTIQTFSSTKRPNSKRGSKRKKEENDGVTPPSPSLKNQATEKLGGDRKSEELEVHGARKGPESGGLVGEGEFPTSIVGKALFQKGAGGFQRH